MRPVVLTVEWQHKDSPTGYPEVSDMRPMSWWEHLIYVARKRLSHCNAVPNNVFVKKSDFSVAVEISRDQYTKLLLGDVKAVKAMQYMQGQDTATLELIPPSHANTVDEQDEDQV